MKSGEARLPDVTIRDYRADDYESLISLWEGSGLPYKPRGRDRRERIEHEIEHPNAIFLVAEADGGIIGTVIGTHEGRKGWINRLAVAPAFRRMGIAARLVAEVERRMHDQGIEIYACLIEDWNTVSMEVFRRLGYEYHKDVLYFSKRKNKEI